MNGGSLMKILALSDTESRENSKKTVEQGKRKRRKRLAAVQE
jgi:hypothetical protein